MEQGKEIQTRYFIYLIDCRSERFMRVLLFGHEAITSVVTTSNGNPQYKRNGLINNRTARFCLFKPEVIHFVFCHLNCQRFYERFFYEENNMIGQV